MQHAFLFPDSGLFPIVAIIALTFLLAGFVKGVIGLGLPTVAIGILGLLMAPTEAAALLIVPSLVTNVWQLAAGRNFRPLLRRLWPLLIGICVGTLAGIALFSAARGPHATAILGGSLLLYGAVGMAPLRLSVPARMEKLLAPLVGTSTGIVAAVTGVFVIPAVPYLQALELERDDLVQALGLALTVSTIALGAGLAHIGTLHPSVAGASLLALVPTLGGMLLGQWVRTRISPAVFRRCFFLGMLALGCHLLVQALIR
jgi:uncharacterized membrane protein YfcA